MEVEHCHTAPAVPEIIANKLSRTRDETEELSWKQDANHRPANPKIIATKYTYAKSQKIAIRVPKNKHDVTIVLYSKSNRIATQVYI